MEIIFQKFVVCKLYPPGGFTNYLHSNPFANHPFDKKIEAAKLSHEAAHEQTKCKMLETYTQLLLVSTDQLSAYALAERKLALESMRLALFPKV